MNKLLYYIDNDSDDLTTFLYAAKSLDVEVRLFKNGEQVLDQLKQSEEKPCAIFVDLNMPRIDGFEVISRIVGDHELAPVPLIAFSTANDDVSIQRAANAGATCYIAKPNTIARLKKILNFAVSTTWQGFDRNKNFLVKRLS